MDPGITLDGDVAELDAAIEHHAVAIVAALAAPASASAHGNPAGQLAEHQELARQLDALRGRVARARAQIADPRQLRAELATLLFFASTLRADAENLRARLGEELEQLARQQLAARVERQRLAAERQEKLRRRDALQAKIVRAAEGMAHGDRTECRRTVPVIALDEGVTVCSIGVRTPRRRFHFSQFWLVTLTDARDDVLIRPT